MVSGVPVVTSGGPVVVFGRLTVVSGGPFVVFGRLTVVSGGPVVVLGRLTVVSGGPVVISGGPVVLSDGPVVMSGGLVVDGGPTNKIRLIKHVDEYHFQFFLHCRLDLQIHWQSLLCCYIRFFTCTFNR